MPDGTPDRADGRDAARPAPGATGTGTGEVPRVLNTFDVTNITVGAIVGADIYVASAITAGCSGRPRCWRGWPRACWRRCWR